MATPAYETITAKIVDLLKTIKPANGYASTIAPQAVTRKLLLPGDLSSLGYWPTLTVVRRGSGGDRISQPGFIRATMPLQVVCLQRVDQSNDEQAETVANLLQNDIQRCLRLAANFSQLRALGAVDVGFPDEPHIFEESAKSGLIISTMRLHVDVTYYLPHVGY